jgi:hypothetical protein
MLIKKELKVSVQLEQPSIGSGLMELTTLFVFCGTLPCSYPAKQTCESLSDISLTLLAQDFLICMSKRSIFPVFEDG